MGNSAYLILKDIVLIPMYLYILLCSVLKLSGIGIPKSLSTCKRERGKRNLNNLDPNYLSTFSSKSDKLLMVPGSQM